MKLELSVDLYAPNVDPPTLHEIRSLGASLYREAGWPEGQVQLLLGHSDIQMTRHYLEGHEAPVGTNSGRVKPTMIRY